MIPVRTLVKYAIRNVSRPMYNISQMKFKSTKINQIDFTLGDPNASNQPVSDIKNPYEKEKVVCILCQMKIVPDYKNVKLLSQFISSFTGKVYGRHITGLCKEKQKLVEIEIEKSRKAGLMPTYFKDPVFCNDPELFDPDRPLRNHPY